MPNATPPQNAPLVSGEFKKMLVVPAMTLIIAVVVAWYAAQQSQSELRYKVETLEKNEIVTAASIKANTDAINQMVITMARNADAMTRIAEDLKNLQAEQRASLNRK